MALYAPFSAVQLRVTKTIYGNRRGRLSSSIHYLEMIMTIIHSINKSNNLESSGHLNQLGWSTFFSDQLKDISTHLVPAKITGVRKNTFLARKGDREIQATIAGRLFNDPEMTLPVVGDWVLLRESVITKVLLRKNALSRRVTGGRTRKNSEMYADNQVIAANLDMVFIVCGLDRDFNLRRIERYITLAYNCNIEPVVILTKSDLQQHPDQYIQEVTAVAIGVSVYTVSKHENEAVSQLTALLSKGKTAALIGSSGAGKSTLINRLAGKEIRTTGEAGAKVGKGTHTTPSRDLTVLSSGGMVIDNPGIREIALSIDSEGTSSAFPDIDEIARFCKFQDCSHSHEPGCRVLEAVSNGEVSLNRLKNFRKLKNELTYHWQRENKNPSQVEKERWKGVSLKIKSMRKRR